MNHRSFIHVVCAVLLLVAQHVAVTHSVWHLQDHLPAQAQADSGIQGQSQHDERSPESKLCDLHFALGSLLAGDCPAHALPVTDTANQWGSASFRIGLVAQPLLTPPSRAPPVLL